LKGDGAEEEKEAGGSGIGRKVWRKGGRDD